jgi:hypothetical protein
MSKQIRITVDPQGQISVKAEGYAGVTCKDATKVFETLGDTISRTSTSDAYTQDQIQTVEIVNAYN